jgi:hypothetical protein
MQKRFIHDHQFSAIVARPIAKRKKCIPFIQKKNEAGMKNTLSLSHQSSRANGMHPITDNALRLTKIVENLLQRYRDLTTDHEQLRQEYFRLVETIQRQKTQIEILEATDKTKQPEETLTKHNKPDKQTKQIIQEMMREIDTCLLILENRDGY